MAQIVNLREDEYRNIVTELAKMHTDQLQNIETIINEMKTLVTSEDAFSTDLTSKKMVDMLDTLSDDVMTLLKQVFQDSEAGVANMITTTVTTDSACG